MAAYSWNIMWLDCILLFPLIVYGLERLVREQKGMLYCVTLGLSILSNYYISIMTCLFLVLYFIALLILEEPGPVRKYVENCVRFGIYSLLSGGLAAGVLLPEIRIRENFRLKPSQYAIFINGIKADEADIPADKLMALPSSETYGEIDGVLGNDPAYGMPVTWIQPAQKAKALNMGYQVIDSASVIVTHVNKIVRSYIPDLFNYDDITQLHNRLSSMAPRLAEDLSAALNYSQLLKVYRALLTEGVSLRDIVTIATVLVASSAVTKDHILLAADVRLALRRSITHPFVRKQELTVYTLNNELENLLTNVVNQAQQGGKVMLDSVPVDPNMLNQFQSTMPQVKEQMKAAGKDPVLLVPPQLRPLLARYARLFAPGLHVLSYNEVPDELELKIMGALM